MKRFVEPVRELDVLADADVVVLGGGPGGLPAAVAAARSGFKTIIVVTGCSAVWRPPA